MNMMISYQELVRTFPGVITIIIFSLLYLALWTENSLDSVTNFGWMLSELAKRLLKP